MMKMIYQGDLPHIQPPGATLFITFRLAGSLPKSILNEISDEFERLTKIIKSNHFNKKTALKERLELIYKYDNYIHNSSTGPHYMKNPVVAKMVCDAIHFHDDKLYELITFCVMSNHVHLLLTPNQIQENEYVLMSKIMHSIKSYTATEANRILKREGQFWTHESFDHYIRNESELEHIIQYIMDNPVKAKQVKKSEDWPWAFSKNVPPTSMLEES